MPHDLSFQNWHWAIKLKRYMLRSLQELPRIQTLGGVLRSALNQADSIVRPMHNWLADQGIGFQYGTKVIDADFLKEGDDRRIEVLHCPRDDANYSYQVDREDLVVLTRGSMTGDACWGGRRSCTRSGPRQARRCLNTMGGHGSEGARSLRGRQI